MKIRTPLSLILFASCALVAPPARAQGTNPRLSAARVKSKTAVVLTENDKRKDKIELYTRAFKLNPNSLKVDPGVLKALLPDLMIGDVAMTTAAASSKQKWYVKIENKGAAKSASCNLRFRHGTHLLDYDSLETQDFIVPPIEAGKSTLIYFEPPHKAVNWWVFGVNVDPDHAQIKEKTQTNNVYVIEVDAGEVFVKPKQ